MKRKIGNIPLIRRLSVKNSRFQKIFIIAVAIIAAFFIILTGAAPKKYKLVLGQKSPYDITAPRDIVNKTKVEEKAKAAEASISAVIKEDSTALLNMFVDIDNFVTKLTSAINEMKENIEQSGISKDVPEYQQKVSLEKSIAANKFIDYCKTINVSISNELAENLISNTSDDEIIEFKNQLMDIINDAVESGITEDNLETKTVEIQNELQSRNINGNLKTAGLALVKAIIRPIKTVDNELTALKKQEAYEQAYKEAEKTEKILEGERIISVGDIVTQDKLDMLNELGLLDSGKTVDWIFALGVLFVIIMLVLTAYIYMKSFCEKVIKESKNLILISVIFILVLLMARIAVVSLPSLAIPIFLAVIMVSVLFDYKAGIIINLILTILISVMIKGNIQFIYMAVISGTLTAFIVTNINQRSRLSLAGFAIGAINSLIILCTGLLYKSGLEDILTNAGIVFLNGVVSTILAIGILPLLEILFDVITPLKLLELANPNQPLMKRLLLEAPGTYHHSLMVGNMAEIALESIGGDALLARVGAYYHDIGKLIRPYFFKENQMSDNPHDKMKANLSTLVITSHVSDGVRLAEKYKLPQVIKDIIKQHHGTTLVAYFYHKAVNIENNKDVDPDNFRYPGPKPLSREAAVVMLADSVEAAVRSMQDKSKGKIEALVRKIIKDKLDDGQLDMCDLTLKDLEKTAQAFLSVLSGIFHERQEYPEINLPKGLEDNVEANLADAEEK